MSWIVDAKKNVFRAIVAAGYLLSLMACGDSSETESPPPVVADTTPPVITLNGDTTMSLNYGATYNEAGATAIDAVDGQVAVVISGEVNTTEPTTHTITYTATDNSGNQSQATRQITVAEQRPFITTWNTSLDGITNYNQVLIDTEGDGYNYSVDWGDGTIDHDVKGDIVHTYESAGIYSVSILGDFPHFYLANVEFGLVFEEPNLPIEANTYKSDNRKLLSVEQWGDIRWRSMHSSFRDADNLTINSTDTPNLSGVEDMSLAFAGIGRFNSDITHWDVSNIKNMQSMFEGAGSFNQDIGNWNVSNVTNMSAMFKDVRAFNQDISSWDVSSVTNMKSMFELAIKFNQNISGWNVSNVTDMSYMFKAATVFNQDISIWDLSNVTGMSYMFQAAYAFNQDISEWDVSSVTNMKSMFQRAIKFNQNITGWNVSNVTDMSYMFSGVTLSTENYDATLLGWSNLQLQQDIEFDGGYSKYSEKSAAARQSLIEQFNWTIIDGGSAN